jgi:hypothetical protein
MTGTSHIYKASIKVSHPSGHLSLRDSPLCFKHKKLLPFARTRHTRAIFRRSRFKFHFLGIKKLLNFVFYKIIRNKKLLETLPEVDGYKYTVT